MSKLSFTPRNSERVFPEEKGHVVRCYSLIEVGHVPNDFPGAKSTKPVHKIQVGFEFVNTNHVFEEAKGAEPLVMSQTYSVTAGKQSKLPGLYSALMGGKMVVGKEVILTDMVGKYAYVNVEHTTKQDGSKSAKISSIIGLPDEMAKSPARLKDTILVFSITDDKQYTDIYAKLPQWQKEDIAKSEEFKARFGGNSFGDFESK